MLKENAKNSVPASPYAAHTNMFQDT